MLNNEIINTFNERRDEFKGYGFTCELWKPNIMKRPDRHNEIEINYFIEGSITYLFQDKPIIIPAKKIAVFWGLVPHQIIHYDNSQPYFVCTIPFSQFLEWQLPTNFVRCILNGEIVHETSEEFSCYDEFLFGKWIKEIEDKDFSEVALIEMRARLMRLAVNQSYTHSKSNSDIMSREITVVEKIAIYIAQNYRNPLKVTDIGKAVGLHPDYANNIFKKAFGCTLSDYIIHERVSHAQRKLVASNISITQIAFDCGFNSISSFNTAFLKINNCTPREFRKNNK
ncbi:helix-turn-helix domain-containing protein [Flavobacterium sp. ST-75]|uniref:Helix-turn-helix domain-containing protein n=1 Tax=Flavobacterium rhizophilum TaxID=3163296 RepID=A0ABW8YBW1_9FLAO